MPDPLPTGSVAAVADAVTASAQLASQLEGYANTPEMLAAHVAQMNAGHLAAVRAAINLAMTTGDFGPLQLLLTPATT
jgi:hypothetical protein